MLAPLHNDAVNDLVRELMGAGTPFSFRVVSGSMAPTLQVGDRVTARQVEADDLQRGDIVVYAVDDALRVHRLLATRSQGDRSLLVTKGDSAPSPDQPWSEEALLGKVTAIHRGEARIQLDAKAWRAANRLLGTLSRIEVLLFRLGRRLKRAVIGERMAGLTPHMMKLIRTPSTLCAAFAARLWSRQERV